MSANVAEISRKFQVVVSTSDLSRVRGWPDTVHVELTTLASARRVDQIWLTPTEAAALSDALSDYLSLGRAQRRMAERKP